MGELLAGPDVEDHDLTLLDSPQERFLIYSLQTVTFKKLPPYAFDLCQAALG